MGEVLFSAKPVSVPHVRTANRVIATPIPTPGTEEVLRSLHSFESRSMHGQLPIVWDHARDFSIYDRAGNKWIDFTSTIFVTNIGHANEALKTALVDVVQRDLIHSYTYATDVRARYLERLIDFAGPPFEKAFLLSAGTEATEAAFKLMRLHGQKRGKRRLGIITVEGNWHGRTLGAQMLSSNQQQKAWIGNLDPDIHHIPFPYPWATDDTGSPDFLAKGLAHLKRNGIDLAIDICGVLLETFQGWGAVFYPKPFVQALEALCRRHGILLAFDEMQSGFARTGETFGYRHYDVTPDLICCGKGMGSGVALSGVLGLREVMDLPEVGNMSSTHSANPLACTAGLVTLDEIRRMDLVAETRHKGRHLSELLDGLRRRTPERISYVLGKGLIAAILFRDPATGAPDAAFTSRVALGCMNKGVLVVHTGRESIKLGPPLTITDAALSEGIGVMADAIDEAAGEA